MDIAIAQRKYQTFALILCYVVPLIWAFVFLFLGVYGAADVYCSIRSSLPNSEQLMYNFLAYFGILFLTIIFNVYCYIKVIWIMKNSGFGKEANAIFFELLLYPLGLIICYSFTCADRIYLSFGEKITWLEYVHVFLLQLQGFVNALIYGMNYQVRTQIRRMFKRCKNRVTTSARSLMGKRSESESIMADRASSEMSLNLNH